MLKLCRGFLRSTKTAVALLVVFALGVLSSVVGHYTTIRFERVGFVPFLQEVNSWLVSARIAYPKVYFSFLAFLAALLAMVLYVRLAERREGAREQVENFRRHFRLFKPMNEVDPEKELAIQRYKDYYLPRRDADEAIRAIIGEGGYPLVLGIPSMGKTRTAWEAAKRIANAHLLVPDLREPPLAEIPFSTLRRMSVVLLLDDLNKWAGIPQVDSLRGRLREDAAEFHCVATCRTGEEYQSIERTNPSLLRNFREVKLPDLSDEEGVELCREIGEVWEEKRAAFNRTPGSLLLDLGEMRRRYEHSLPPHAKAFLHAVKLLYLCGIYEYRVAVIREVTERVFGMSMDDEAEVSVFSALVDQTGLLAGRGDPIQVYDPYLEQCVSDYPANEAALVEHREKLFRMVTEAADFASLFYMGNKATEVQDLAFAARCYEQSLQIHPTSEVHNNYGILLRGMERREEAEEHYLEALLLSPEDEEAHYNYANLLGDLGRREEAEEHYIEALRLNPEYLDAHNNYANLLGDLGRRGEAEEHYIEALLLSPEDEELHSNYAILLRGLGRRQEAEEHYVEALRLNPEYLDAHNNYANLLGDLGRREEAEEHYIEGLRLNPQSAAAHHNYAILLTELGRVEEAGRHFEDAYRLDPKLKPPENQDGTPTVS